MKARRIDAVNPGDCDDIETHTACPAQYNAWHEWADRMRETHDQTRCPSCGFWEIWVLKDVEPPAELKARILDRIQPRNPT